MQMNIHLNFNGNAAEAFTFYKDVFAAEKLFFMPYSDAPAGAPVPAGWGDKLMHASMPLGKSLLMGCDAPPERSRPVGGFQISVESKDEAEVRRIYAQLSDGGSVQMPLAPTFWSPLFGMCTDKFGVAWMVGVPGENPA
jgi:PhnB protein